MNESVNDVVKRMETILARVENERDAALGVLGEIIKYADGGSVRPGVFARARELVNGE